MLTRCPSCATHFRVTAEQLKLRAGRVRCGECQHVFSALDTLIEEPAVVMAAPAAVSTMPPVPASPLRVSDEIAVPPAPTPDVAEVPIPLAAPEAPAVDEAIAEGPGAESGPPDQELPAPEPVTESRSAMPDDGIGPIEAAGPPADAESRPEDLSSEPAVWDETYAEPPAPRRWPWAIGSLLALLALGLQAILGYRMELAVLWPESRPALLAACASLGCEVALPAKVALVGIEASDLHPDPAQKGRLALTATLKNRAPFAQQFPHLELTLTDTADKAIVRKVLSPDQYLPRSTVIANGMAPNADLAAAVALDAGELPASGYRLYIFYP